MFRELIMNFEGKTPSSSFKSLCICGNRIDESIPEDLKGGTHEITCQHCGLKIFILQVAKGVGEGVNWNCNIQIPQRKKEKAKHLNKALKFLKKAIKHLMLAAKE